jgi:two-component system, LytTR family, response regulator
MTTLRILFADDELMARRRVRRLLEAMADVEIVAECESGEAALRELDRLDVDVALLDVGMGAVSGLAVSDLAAELGVEVVFTTAHPGHAVEAFDRGAVDYVLKPLEADRLATAVARARQRVDATRFRAAPAQAGSSVAPLAPLASFARLALESNGEVRLVHPDDVSHALHDGELVSVWAAGQAILTDRSLTALEAALGGSFLRVHRRALVNLAHVDRLRPVPTGGYIAVTRGGHEVPVSRQAARGLRRSLGLG